MYDAGEVLVVNYATRLCVDVMQLCPTGGLLNPFVIRIREAAEKSFLVRTCRRPDADVASRLLPQLFDGVIQTVVLAHPGLIRPLNFNKISDLREFLPPAVFKDRPD